MGGWKEVERGRSWERGEEVGRGVGVFKWWSATYSGVKLYFLMIQVSSSPPSWPPPSPPYPYNCYLSPFFFFLSFILFNFEHLTTDISTFYCFFFMSIVFLTCIMIVAIYIHIMHMKQGSLIFKDSWLQYWLQPCYTIYISRYWGLVVAGWFWK